MRKVLMSLVAVGGIAALMAVAVAQPPDGKGKGKAKGKTESGSTLVDRMMAFDKNKDGKLTKEEITDERLMRLFEMADANKDGTVTREELAALAAKLDEEGGKGGPGKGGKGGFGKGKGGFGKGGFPGGPGGFGRGFGGPAKPGTVLPAFLVDRLELTAEQKKQLDALQKDVDTKLGKILTSEQKKMLETMGPGPGGPGGPGGRGPGGRPPRDE